MIFLGGHDARVELNAALSRKMADIEKRKRAANKKDQTKVEDKLRDEIRTLHEAYQYLSRKYIKLAETLQTAKEEAAAEEALNAKNKKEEIKKQIAAANAKAGGRKETMKSLGDLEKYYEDEFGEEFDEFDDDDFDENG